MEEDQSRHIIIAGAGIAGLTAALAFAQCGFFVQIFERRERFAEAGAGIQLSPNATRLLRRLGVLQHMRETAVQPPAILLRDARSLATLARLPLGAAADERWGAPYLVVHRADLQAALLATVSREQEIRLVTGSAVRDVAVHRRGVTVSVDTARGIQDVRGLLLVGADGVWSTIRGLSGLSGASRFTGSVAWRQTIRATPERVAKLTPDASVCAHLSAGFHLVAYPVRGGSSISVVAFTRGPDLRKDWSERPDTARLTERLRRSHEALTALPQDGWSSYPLHVVDPGHPWVAQGGVALIGDAAHAMTPFAAQGAAMAIEDAVSLAQSVSNADQNRVGEALSLWQERRVTRVARVRRRGAFNRFVWHAAGPVAWGRDLVLRARPEARLIGDFDWLYGHDAAAGYAPARA